MKGRPLFYLLVVVLLLPHLHAELNVSGGYIYEVSLIVEAPLSGTTWLGLYGFVDSVPQKFSASYFETPFAIVSNLTPTDTVREVELNLQKTLAYPSYSSESNWYVLVSPSGDVNLHSLSSTCDANVDALVEGNFCEGCTPSLTYEENDTVYVNDVNYCAKRAVLYGEVNTYLLEWNGYPVYLTPLREFNLDGNLFNFAFLVSADGSDLYLYMARNFAVCGDGVCDPGEEGNCGDCVSLEVNVSPDTQEINAGEATQYTVTLTNTGDNDLDVSLYLSKVSGPENYTYTFDATSLTVLSHSSRDLTLTLAASDGGAYLFRVIARVNEVNVPSNSFYLIVRTPTTEENEETGGEAGGGAAPPPEENITPPPEENKIVVTPRGYYVPWLGCVSYLHVYSLDAVKLALNEEKNVPVVIQNAGTCEENVELNVMGLPPGFTKGLPKRITLSKGQSVTVDVTFVGASPGSYRGTISARGYYEAKREISVIVSGEKKVEKNCESRVMILSPDVITIVEGEDINRAAEIINEGTCIEEVDVKLTKSIEGTPVIIDSRQKMLPEGERYIYAPPKLAAGEYELNITAGGYTKTSKIIVKPQSAVTSVAEALVIRARFFLLALLLLVLLAAVSYIRSRYLS